MQARFSPGRDERQVKEGSGPTGEPSPTANPTLRRGCDSDKRDDKEMWQLMRPRATTRDERVLAPCIVRIPHGDEAPLGSRRVEAAFFDLDKTVIAKASMVAFGRPFYREGLITRRLLLRALYGQLVYMYLGADEDRLARMRDSVLALTKGWSQSQVREIVEETLHDVVEPIVYDEALGLIREHRNAGRAVYIVSASPEEIVAPLARYLGVDGHLATLSSVDDEGRYTGTTELYCYGPQKADAMIEVAKERGIDLSASYAYSDSATDIPMLECVGHAIAVNPDRELQRVAREQGWEIRTFTRRVPLRERMPTPPPGPTTAIGGLVAAAIGGGAVWWWLRRDPAGAAKRTAERSEGGRTRRRGPFERRRQRAQQEQSGEGASSWRRILERSSPSRARRDSDQDLPLKLPRRLRGFLPQLT
jgi:HAD superfamily hydrolase (TIGR01490 family)